MEILRTILLAFEVIVCLLLIGIILIQRSKGGGLGVAFGGGGDQLFGSRTGNVLTKGTIILSVAFFVNTIVLAMMSSNRAADKSLLEQAIQNQAQAPAQTAPAQQPSAMPAPTGVPTLPESSFDVTPMPEPAGEAL